MMALVFEVTAPWWAHFIIYMFLFNHNEILGIMEMIWDVPDE